MLTYAGMLWFLAGMGGMMVLVGLYARFAVKGGEGYGNTPPATPPGDDTI